VDADVESWLLYLLASPDAQDNAVVGLFNLSKHPSGRRTLVEADRVGLVVDTVNVAAKAQVRQNVAVVLFYLSSSMYYNEISHVVPTLVHLARDDAYCNSKKRSCRPPWPTPVCLHPQEGGECRHHAHAHRPALLPFQR
jgi:hypothetical protein